MRFFSILFFFIFISAGAQTSILSEAYASADHYPVNGKVNTNPIGLDLMGGAEKGLTIFPNAGNDHLLVSVAGSAADKKSVVIVNSTNNQVFKMQNRRENTFMIDIQGLRTGLYFIEVKSGSSTYRKKFIKQ